MAVVGQQTSIGPSPRQLTQRKMGGMSKWLVVLTDGADTLAPHMDDATAECKAALGGGDLNLAAVVVGADVPQELGEVVESVQAGDGKSIYLKAGDDSASVAAHVKEIQSASEDGN